MGYRAKLEQLLFRNERKNIIRNEKENIKNATYDVRIEDIARELGVDIRSAKIKGATGRLGLDENDKPYILVASGLPEGRRNFTIAHELAHLALHYDTLLKNRLIDRFGDASTSPEMEAAANRYAAMMLMLPALVKDYVERFGVFNKREVLTEVNARHAARMFAVSVRAIKISIDFYCSDVRFV